MANTPKYPSQKLTKEDIDILEKIITRYLVKFYALTQKYPNPKVYAEKVILRRMQSNGTIGTLYVMASAINYPSNHIFEPGQINKKLASDIRNAIGQDYRDLSSEQNDNGLLHSRDLRERVLDKLEVLGIFVNISGKKEIRQESRSIKKGNTETKIKDDRGGKPSAEKLTDDVKKLKKVMEKPESLDFLYEKIIKSGLAHKLAKYKLLAVLHAAKMDEKILHKMMGIGATFMRDNIGEKDAASFKLLHQGLQFYDDNQLEEITDNIAESLIQDRGYYVFLFLSSLLKY
jgi:hypothetical protein